MSRGNRRQEDQGKQEGRRVGLCVDCRHMMRIESARGSTFYLCQRSATDPRFPKYPRLPVLTCSGYERKAPDDPDKKP